MAGRVRNKTKSVLSSFAILFALMFAITSAGWLDFGPWFVPIIGIMLGVVGLVEVGISQYFNKSNRKQLTAKDYLNLVSAGFFVGVIIQGFLFIPLVQEGVPEAIVSFFGTIGAIVGFMAAALALLQLIMKD